jgi:hypothetical protein
VQRAAELLDLGGHDVHADAAAGRMRERRGGGEAGLEHQLQDGLVAELLLGTDEAQ